MDLLQPPTNLSDPWNTSNYRHGDILIWISVIICAIWAILVLVEYVNTHKSYHLIWALVFLFAAIVFHQITFLGTFRFVISPIGAALTMFIPGGIAVGILYSVFENKRFLEKISYGTIYLIILCVIIGLTFIFGINSETFIINGMTISNILSTTIILFVPFYSTLVLKETSNAAFFMTAYGILAGAGGIFMSAAVTGVGDAFFGIGIYSYILLISKLILVCGVLYEKKWRISIRGIDFK